jgi:hypothetical protein
VVLIALLAMLLVMGGVVLVDHLNSRVAGRVENAGPTASAMQQAKAALIAYAVTDATRPGELPCPDYNRDGVINPIGVVDYNGTDCRVLVGWLPWRTLNLPDLRDGSGARLWYAVSINYFARGGGGVPPPINPDAPGDLQIAGGIPADVVAVVIAPGEATGIDPTETCNPDAPLQTRPSTAPAADTHLGQYLEADNADGDVTFQTTGNCGDNDDDSFNDRLLIITRAELMAAVQKRVAAEVAGVLERYRLNHGLYPWASTFSAPDASSFVGAFGVRSGQLGFTDTTAAGEPDFSYDSALSVTWTQGGAAVGSTTASITGVPGFGVPAASTALAAGWAATALNGSASPQSIPYPGAPGGGATCWWRGTNETVDCDGRTPSFVAVDTLPFCLTDISLGVDVCPPSPPLPVNRYYEFELNYEGAMTVPAGTDADLRVRTVQDTDGSMTISADDTVVKVVDTVAFPADPPVIPAAGVITFTTELRVSDGDTSTFIAGNLYTEPQSPGVGDPTDLPRWFADNHWARFIAISYAPGFAPNGTMNCTAGTDCITVAVRDGAVSVNDARAVVVMSNTLQAGQDRSQATPGGAGFEEDNADANPLTAERKEPGATFNDHLRIVSCQTGACR